MNRAPVAIVMLCLLVVSDVAGFATAQVTGAGDVDRTARDLSALLNQTLRSLGLTNPGTSLNPLYDNLSMFDATTRQYLDRLLLYRETFASGGYGWQEVVLPGDSATDERIWRLEPNAGVSNSTVYSAYSPGSGRIPSGVDRALVGPVLDLRYVRGSGGYVTNWSQPAVRDTRGVVEDFWGPTMNGITYGNPGGTQVPNFGGTNGRGVNLNGTNPLPNGEGTLAPTIGDVNLTFVHRYNLSSTPTQQGMFYDGARLEIRLRGDNGTWSTWVGLNPDMVNAIAAMTDKDYTGRAVVSRAPGVVIGNQEYGLEKPMTIPVAGGIPLNSPLDQRIPGTTLTCNMLYSLDQLIQFGTSGAGGAGFDPGLYNYCEQEESRPMNPGQLTYLAYRSALMRSYTGNQYTGPVVGFGGQQGYTGASVNNSGNLSWLQSTYDLSPYVGYEVQVRFRVSTQPRPADRGEGWSIGNIEVNGKAYPADLGVREVLFPTQNEVLPGGSSQSVVAVLRNYGATRLVGVTATLNVVPYGTNGPAAYTATVEVGSLFPQEEYVVAFPAWPKLGDGGYNLSVSASFNREAPRSATDVWAPFNVGFIDWNPRNDRLAVPIFFRSGVQYSLTPVGFTATPTQSDVDITKYVNFTVRNDGNVPALVNATLFACRVDPYTGLRVNAPCQRVSGRENEERRVVPFSKNLTSLGTDNAFRTFSWTWTPATRGVYDLVATAYTTGTQANAVLRTYVRASAIPYFSEDFNNASTFVQSDPTQMVGPGGLWSVERFPFAPSPHSLSGAWVPDTHDVGVRADAIRRELTVGGITTDPIPIGPYALLPGVTIVEGNASDKGPVSEFPVPNVGGSTLPYKCGSGIGPTVRCRYDDVYKLLADEWKKNFGGVGGGGGVSTPPVGTPSGLGIPGQSIAGVGVFSGLLGSFYNDIAPLQSSLTFLYGGRMHYYLGHEIRIPEEMFEEGHELDTLALEFFHASRMNPNPFQSPASATTEQNVAKYRRTYADHDVVLDDLKSPAEEVYGRILVYPGALLGPAGRNPTVPGNVDSSPGNSIPVGSAPGTSHGAVFINYTDDTAFRRGALATAFGLSSPPGEDPYVLAVYNGTFNWAHENLTIPRSLINQARNGIVTLIFEYATPPGRVHTTQRCAPDPRMNGPCRVDYNADLEEFRELWYVDDIGVRRYSPAGAPQTVFYDEVERTSCVRLQAPECPQNENNHEWSASGWRLREWRNPNPALWNITTIAGFVEAADASGTQRSLWWGNRTANPLAYDDNVWSVLRTPAIDLTLASEPVLIFKHNFSFAAANPGNGQPQDATGKSLALDGGNVRIRVLEDEKLGLWSRPYLLGDSSQYTHQLFIDTSDTSQRSPAEREFIGPGEKPFVFSGRSDVDDDQKSDWVEARFDLSAFRGRTVRIEFHAFSRSDFITARESPFNSPTCSQNTNSCSVDMGWFIDNVRVQESRLANDVRIAEVRAPVPGELFVGPGTQVPLQILVENVGIFPQTSVSASAVITMTTRTGEVSEVYRAAATLKDLRTGGTSKTLQPNEKALLSLPAWAVPDHEGAKFEVRIATSLANSGQAIPDDNTANNLVTLSLEARAIHAIRLRNLTLDPSVGDMNELRKVSVEVVNTGNMVEDFTKFNGLRIRISAREAGDTEWSPLGSFTLLQLRLKEIWRPATPLTWKPTNETTYELKAEAEFTYPSDTGVTIPGLEGTYATSLVETRTATRVLSRFFSSDGEGLIPPTLTASPLWGLREDAPYAGLASWGFPGTGAKYPHDAEGILQFGPLNLYAAQSAILTFMHRYDFEAGYDGGIVEWSTDGQKWTPLSQDPTTRRLSSGAPLVSDPAVPLYAYTGTSAGWERAFYDLGLNRAFTRNAQIADLSLADLQAQSTVWTRSFTDLGPGGMWRSTGAGLAAGYRYTHYLNLDVDLRNYSLASGYAEGSLRFSDLRNLPPATGGGAPSRFAVRVVDPVTGAELGVLIPESAENDNYRDWQTNNLRLDLASYGGRKVRIQFVHVSLGASQHPSSDYGWFIDNVRVTANRGGSVVNLHGGATGDSIEYASVAAAAAGNWSAAHYREALAAGGARGFIPDPSWVIVNEVKGLGWAKDPLINHLSIPRAGPVDSRLIFPLNLSAAADDVSLYLQGMFSFPIDTVTGRVVGGSRIQVSLVDPTKDPERAPWITVPLSDKQPPSVEANTVTTAPIRGHTPFGTDREQNSAFGPDGEGLGGSYRHRPGDLGLAFNLTQWRGQAVWVSLQAFTPSTNLAYPEWSLTRVLVRAEVLNATNVSFRFRAATDANNDGEGWRIDNLTLVGYKRDIDLSGAITGLPAHRKVPAGDLPFDLVVENRGFKDAEATATLTLRRVSGGLPQTHVVKFTVTNESVLRIPIAGAFTVADSATGVAYRLETLLSVPDGRGGTRKFALPDTTLLGVQPERSGIRVESVTVTPNLASRDDLSPLKVVAVIINDDTMPQDALAYLRMYNATGSEWDEVTEDPLDRDAAVVTPTTRKIGPGERATFTWTIERASFVAGRSLPAGPYIVQVTPDAEGLKEGVIARHFELLEGQSFLQLYGYIGNAVKIPAATPSGKFAATPVWWTMDDAWYTDNADYYRLDAFDEGGFGRGGSALHLTARGSRREVTPIQDAVVDRVLDLRAWDKAYLSFMHRYSFGERVVVPSDPSRYNEVTKASSGGYLEACVAEGQNMRTCAQPWKVIHPVAHNERGELVKGAYPDHIVSIGSPPNPTSQPAVQNENYNALADSWPAPMNRKDLHFVPGFSGQSPGYGVDPSNPEGWVPAIFDLSEFKGQYVLVRARAGVSSLGVEANWLIDYLSISPHLPSIGPGQTLSVADGVSKAYRFNLRNDGAVTQDVNVTANRAGIPPSWNFTLVDDQPAGPLAGENRVVRLNPGESRVVTLRVDIPIQRAFESDRRVLLEARNMEDVLKGTAAPFALAFKPRAWPDLVVDSVKLRDDKPLVDTTQPVTVRIRNTGDLEARNVRVVLKDYYYADPEDITSEVVTVVPLLDGASADGVTLQPFGATTDIVFNWRPRTSGYHVLIVQVDPDFLQTEYNLDNNVMRRVVDVRPPMESDLSVRLDLVRENGNLVTDSVPQGESVTVRLTLRNIGTADAQAVYANIQAVLGLGGDFFPLLLPDPYAVGAAIPPGESRVIETRWTPFRDGTYTLTGQAFVQGGTIPERLHALVPTDPNSPRYSDDNIHTREILVVRTGLKLTLDPLRVSGLPGKSLTVPFNLTNSGNAPAAILLEAVAPEGFTVFAKRGAAALPEVTLNPEAMVDGVLSVSIPPDALAGTYKVTFLARSGGESVTRTLTVDVLPQHNLRVDAKPLTAAPGMVLVPVTLVNRGNVPETLEVTLVTGPNTPDEAVVVTAPLTVAAANQASVTIPVAVPSETRAKAYSLTLRFASADGSGPVDTLVQVPLTLTRSGAVSLSADSASVRLATGDTLKTGIEVSNVGNVHTRVTLEPVDLPGLLTVQLGDATHALDLGGKGRVDVTLTASPRMVPGTYALTLRAVNADDGVVLGNITVPVIVTGVDYVLTDLAYTPKFDLKPGNEVRLTAVVRNAGGLQSGDVPVAFFVDGHLVNYTTVSGIKPGETATVEFTWTVLEGVHVLWVGVDPHERLAESDRSNNARIVELDGGTAESGLLGGLLVPNVSPLLWVALVGVLATVLHRGRRTLEEKRR